MKFYYFTNTFDPHIFDNEMTSLFKFFESGTETRIVSFSKWKKYYNLNFYGTFKVFCCTLC